MVFRGAKSPDQNKFLTIWASAPRRFGVISPTFLKLPTFGLMVTIAGQSGNIDYLK
jgi:hypothetical protein